MAEGKSIDAKFLDGLTFSTSEAKKVKKDGQEKTQYIPVERPLRPGDVIDWKDLGDSVTIVTADGKKYSVDKKKGVK